MTLAQNNEQLAISHMQRFCRAAFTYRDAPVAQLRSEAARTMRVQSRLLYQLAESGDKTLTWAANETSLVLTQFKIDI